MSRTPRVPDVFRKSPSRQRPPKHQQPDEYKNQFLDQINSCLQETAHLSTNRKQKPEPGKRQSQIPKRSTTKRSMIPTSKRPVKKEIVPLKETDMNHVFELTGVSGSPSPCTTPQRVQASTRKMGTPTRSRVAPSSPHRSSKRNESLSAHPQQSEQLKHTRSPAKSKIHEDRTAPLETQPDKPTKPREAPVETQPEEPEIVNDLIVFSDSPVKEEAVGNLIDFSPVPAPKINEDLINLLSPPKPLGPLIDLTAMPETPKREQEESDSLLDFLSPEKKPQSPHTFLHSLLGINDGTDHGDENEDAVFAFQERLCTIIEVEIVAKDGKRVQVFPTKLNDFLHNRDAIADVFAEEEDLEVSHEPVKSSSSDDEWVAVGGSDSPKSGPGSPLANASGSSALSPQPGISSEAEMSPVSPAFLSPMSDATMAESTPEKIKPVVPKAKKRKGTPVSMRELRKSWQPSPKPVLPEEETTKPGEIPVDVRRIPASPLSPRRTGGHFGMASSRKGKMMSESESPTPRKTTPRKGRIVSEIASPKQRRTTPMKKPESPVSHKITPMKKLDSPVSHKTTPKKTLESPVSHKITPMKKSESPVSRKTNPMKKSFEMEVESPTQTLTPEMEMEFESLETQETNPVPPKIETECESPKPQKKTPKKTDIETPTPRKAMPKKTKTFADTESPTPKKTTPRKTKTSTDFESPTPRKLLKSEGKATPKTNASGNTTPKRAPQRRSSLKSTQKDGKQPAKKAKNEIPEANEVVEPEKPESPKLPFNFDLKEMQRMFRSPAKVSAQPTPPSVERKRLASTLVREDSSSDSSD